MLEFRTIDHPEANGRRPVKGDQQWVFRFPLETGEELIVRMGKKGRDYMFGMMIADCHEHGETEPEAE